LFVDISVSDVRDPAPGGEFPMSPYQDFRPALLAHHFVDISQVAHGGQNVFVP
jgi:hypothetical protein